MVRRVPPHRAYLRIGSEGAKEGAPWRAPDQVIAALPRLPQVRAARQSTAHRQQIRWGLAAGRKADHLVPRGPSRRGRK